MPEGQDITQVSKATQFGQPGALDPAVATRMGSPKYSVRNAIRRAAARAAKGSNSTNAEHIAEKMIEMAKSGDLRAAEAIIEQVDGKVPQMNINQNYQRLEGMTDEELLAKYNANNEALAANGDDSDSGDIAAAEGGVAGETDSNTDVAAIAGSTDGSAEQQS